MPFQYHRLQYHRPIAWIASVVVLCTWTSLVLAQAQPPRELTKEQDKLARDFLRGKGAESAEIKDALVLKIKTEVMKLSAPVPQANSTFEEWQNLAKLSNARNTFDSSYITGAKNPVARKIVAKTVAESCSAILAQPNVAIQSKINLMALLAEMDEKAAEGENPPDPSGDALKVLFQYANAPQAPVYLRAIALHGMNRHLGRWWSDPTHWNANIKNPVVSLLDGIINSEPKSALDVNSHAWLQRRAYDCLTTIRSPGAKGGSAVIAAIKHLGDSKTLPSVRMSALEYLSHLDLSDKKFEAYNRNYLIGMSHLLRSQLVNWYEREDDTLKSKSGAMGGMAGGMGGYAGGYGGDAGMMGGDAGMMGGGYGGDAGMMGGGGMPGGGYGGEGGGYGMMGGGEGAYGGAGNRPKPKDTQTWQVRLARRHINQISQAVHVALDGKPMADEGIEVVEAVKPISAAQLPADLKEKIVALIEAVDEFQTAVNDPARVRDMTSLLTQAEGTIEEIMDLVKEIPGFLDKYPELTEDDELDSAIDPNAKPQPADPNAPADPSAPVDPNAPADPSAPVDPNAPADPSAPANPSAPAGTAPVAAAENATAANN